MKNKEDKYKIVLITTPGCQGCTIMENNIIEAVRISHKSIELEKIELSKDNKNDLSYCNKYNIHDFPSILMFKNNELKLKYTGSMPIIVILRWIDIHFK